LGYSCNCYFTFLVLLYGKICYSVSRGKNPTYFQMKTFLLFLFYCGTGLILIYGCAKESDVYISDNFTNKEGGFYIPIDTNSKSFYAYYSMPIAQGRLKGIFYDTLRSSFHLAIISEPFWDSVYHERDTLVFPTLFKSHILSIETTVDLKNFKPPYHFLLYGLKTCLKESIHGNPWVVLTIDTHND
jgi:hypothetical protein